MKGMLIEVQEILLFIDLLFGENLEAEKKGYLIGVKISYWKNYSVKVGNSEESEYFKFCFIMVYNLLVFFIDLVRCYFKLEVEGDVI